MRLKTAVLALVFSLQNFGIAFCQQEDTAYFFSKFRQERNKDTLLKFVNDYNTNEISYHPKIATPHFIKLLDEILAHPCSNHVLIENYLVGVQCYFNYRNRAEDFYDFFHELLNKYEEKSEPIKFFASHEKGLIFYRQSNYQQAIQAMQHFVSDATTLKFKGGLYINAHYVIASCYQKLGNIKQAEFYYQKCLNEAIILNNTAWIGLASGNLGNFIYSELGKKEEGKKLLYDDLKYSIKSGNYHSANSVYKKLFDWSLQENDLNSSNVLLDSILAMIQLIKPDKDSMYAVQDYHLKKIKLFLTSQKAGDILKSFDHFLSINEYNQQNIRDQFVKENIAINENYENQQEILLLNSDLEKKKSERNSLVILLMIGFLFGGVLLYLLSEWRKKNHQLKVQINLSDQQKEEIISQKREIEAINKDLRDINQTKDRLFSIVAHDLRSPIATLKSLFELVQNRALTQDEFHELASEIKGSVDVLYLNLEQLLQWSQSQLKGIVADFEEIETQEVIKQHIDLYAAMAAQKNIKLYAEGLKKCTVYADKNHLNLIIRNLISNAIKFSLPNQSVSIHLSCTERYAEISVQDRGVGMSEEQLGKIFSNRDSFSSYGTAGEKGTGLGLLMCKDFVEANGGTISIESKPNAGTRVWFTLPKFPS